jgi:hypothetical protein
VSRAPSPRTPFGAFGWHAGLLGVLALAGACKETLDAGHNNHVPDPCPADAGLSPCPPTGLLDNLIGYWRLDDGPGSPVAYDSSGRGNEGALQGLDTNSAWVAGRSQRALELAHAGWVQVPPSPSIDSITDHLTLSVWVDLESALGPDSWGTALSRQTGTTNYQHYHIALYTEARPSLFLITTDGFALIRPPESVPIGVWTHLAGVYDGKVARLYVNGAEVGSQALTGRFAADTTPVILGGNGNDASGVPTELFPGRIDELMVYARALSVTEIGQLAAGALFAPASRDAGTD